MSDVLELAKERLTQAKAGWDKIYAKARNDLAFLSDDEFAQWDKGEADARRSVRRPVVEIDQLTQYIHQVSNDIRMNTPTIKVIPADSGSDIETAEIIEGRIKAIEYKSNADAAYDMAADFSIKSSIGFIRVDHRYVKEDGFEQELCIKRVVNPQAIMIDPDSIEPDGSDAKYGFVFEEISRKQFEKKYKGKAAVSFGDELSTDKLGDQDMITIAEYFYLEDEEEEYGLLEDGTTEKASGKKYKRTRKIKKPRVMRCWVSGEDLLTEPSPFPGKYIPLVPVYGEEAWVNGKRHLFSLIRKAKSSAMMYNVLASSEIEILLKQQQAPIQAAVGQMRGFEEQWKNSDKAMVLYYHTTDANGVQVPPPQRLQPPIVSSGYASAKFDAENNIKKSLGMYSAALGKREGDSSGKALIQLEQSSDLATMHFGDNLIRSITHVGKIIVCALPEVEDTERVVQIIGKEDEIKQVGINGAMADKQKRTYDFGKGEWDVRVITGAAFTTQRQEAAQMYADLLGKMPDMMPIIGDLAFKYQDAPGAQAISNRLKKLVDPKLLEESERGDEAAIDPQVQALTAEATQVMEVAQAEIQQLQQQLAKMEAETQTAELKRQQDAVKSDIERLKKEQRIAELEIENQVKDYQLQQAQAMIPPPAEESVVQPSEEELMQQLEAVQSERLAKEQQEAEEMAMTQREEELKTLSLQQQQMLIDGISGVQQMLGQLVQAVNKPKSIVTDANGNPVGIS